MKRSLIVAVLCCGFLATASGQTTADKTSADHSGICSYYGSKYEGRRTASGQRFSNHKLTAASRTYPMGTRLRLTNVANGKTAVVVVNDRGPFVTGREISVTRRAARELGFVRSGLAKVDIAVIQN